MKIFSPDFENNERIPERFTCDGKDLSPHLSFEGVPSEAQSLALVVTDPGAPDGVFTHWLVWNIDPTTTEVGQAEVPDDGIEGLSSGAGQEYIGPCPPSGVHHYIFKLYALDTMLDLDPMADRETFEVDIDGHIIAEAELVGIYGRE